MTTATIGVDVLNDIENAERTDWAKWSVELFFAATNDCCDRMIGPGGTGRSDLSDRAHRLHSALCAACADKHGHYALVDYYAAKAQGV